MASHGDDARHSAADVFDDEYAVDDFDAVADGFAPGRVQDAASTRWSIHSEDPSVRDVHAHMADGAAFDMSGHSRNSISKPRDVPNPFTSVEDDDDDDDEDDDDDDAHRSALERSQSITSSSTAQYAPGIAHRISVASSSRNYPRTMSPVQGTGGPSHPYSMYPQGTNLARTLSVSTTASTIRPAARSVSSTQGPTHPYSMYPQNVSEHVEDDHVAGQTPHAQAHIPVGFPGRNQDYVRRQGPEGEEHDIIGADGHSEQLPPYSEYPEDGAPVTLALAGPVVTPQSTGPTSSLPLLPQRPAPPQSMSDPSSVQNLVAMEQLDSSASTASSTNKTWSEKSWKEKRKTRFCGVPFWWYLLSICVVAFIAIVLGASIGGFLSSERKDGPKHGPQGTSTTTLLDASPIPSASSGSPPPTGAYALSLGAPKETQASCLTNSSFASAWDCNLYGTPQMAINIGYEAGGDQSSGTEGADLWGGNNATGINYGTQPPTTQFSNFIAVQDDDEPYRGPAFYFQAYYDKFVIVPAYAIPVGIYSSPPSSKKRDWDLIGAEWSTRRQIIAGDKPWFCFWNQTFIEGFIYANNFTNTSSSSTTSSPASSMVTSTIIEVTGPSTTATLSSAHQATSTSPASHRRRENIAGGNSTDGQYSFADLSSFGYVVKVEERRLPDSPQAYCTQYQILADGTAGVLSDPSTGQIITVALEETDPDYSAYQSASISKTKRSDVVSGECHCEWWSGSGR